MIFFSIKPRIPVIVLTLLLLIGVTAPSLYAHKVSSASLILYLETKEERTFKVSTQIDVESSGDPVLDDEIGPEEAAKIFVETQLVVLIDDEEQPHNVTTELIKATDEETPEALERMQVLVTWEGKLPDDGREVALFLRESSEMSIVVVTVKNGIPGRRLQVMFQGEYSRAENIEPLMEGNPFDKEGTKPTEKSKEPAKPDEPQQMTGTFSYVKAGVSAVFYNMALPLCLLFALVILRGSFNALILPFIIFIVTLSLGISLTALGVMPLVSWSLLICVVVLLTLSVDNLFSFKFRWWRYAGGGVGGFFLGNYLGQSGAMLRLGGIPVEVNRLIPFQLGVDFSLLLGVLLFGLVITVFGRLAQFRNIVVIPVSILLAGVAVFLFLQTKS